MKITCSPEHRYFYKANGYISYENFFDEKLCSQAYHDALNLLHERLPQKEVKLCLSRSMEYGRLLWPHSKIIKKLMINRQLFSLIESLYNERKLQVAFDQLIFVPAKSSLQTVERSFFSELTIGDRLCLNHPHSIVLLNLHGMLNDSHWPLQKGNITLFDAKYELDYSCLANQDSDLAFLMLVICKPPCAYIRNEYDAGGNYFKKLGLSFGDSLNGKEHPMFA